MILNSTPANTAVLSNVGQIGEFRIRNSAKAFSILSSGLYANKIRAIVRELSCNAVDSHIAAGKGDTPFDVHLPNQLEPWFSIRDYGTGLSDDQVVNIYTTYFESTKTDSNDYIGALGLGSKSPFAYTDNFTVTAVKDGVRGIYSAFINENGVPSIVQMMTEDSQEPNGVEVKFSVNDQYDFGKFRQEARNVYAYFKLRPVISGYEEFKFDDPTYKDTDIIPGVHSRDYGNSSIAIMGNIAYPIDVPFSDSNIGQYRDMLGCSLEMHFAIGELDFQASREGLSYIPETVIAIRKKLEAVASVLCDKITVEANAIPNLWDRANFLITRSQQALWRPAVNKYVTDNKPALIKYAHGIELGSLVFRETELAAKFNIEIDAFRKSRHYSTTSTLNGYTNWATDPVTGLETTFKEWAISPATNVYFVVNDLKTGALARARYHWKKGQVVANEYTESVYVLKRADKTKVMDVDGFKKALLNPPDGRFMNASTLRKKDRAASVRGQNVTIMKLVEKESNRYSSYSVREMVWRDAGKTDDFDSKTKFYYLPLSGYKMISKHGYGENDAKYLLSDLTSSGIAAFAAITLYGVRKGDLQFIKKQKNWINLEDHIVKTIKALPADFLTKLAMSTVDKYDMVRYNSRVMSSIDNTNGLFATLCTKMQGVVRGVFNERSLVGLFKHYAPKVKVDLSQTRTEFRKECEEVYDQYPLLRNLGGMIDEKALAHYINLVDKSLENADETQS